ncbi:Septation initiation network scaffold protein cdc11 [Madurella mycetomatis]|uniref:Septation initiation network scaffold protein cdc11 n=1 Tax=Madurella mycetomatis TaxID=100816 RepID=A0A175WGC5_9PEZI|nr:Septation initiation network scaffold protein cdc11 [Madurella mycetomatis]
MAPAPAPAPAWLDSLSEDWVSQPGSADASFAEPTTPARPRDPKQKTKAAASRIPRLSPRVNKSQNALDTNGSNILNERSANEKLTPTTRRTPSKLSQEVTPGNSGRDCHACRSASTSTANSVVRRSFLRRKSAHSSPCKGKGETPEWKRRLVYGDLSYGEPRDLFTSAGTGLENIFKPPQPAPESAEGDDASNQEKPSQFDVTLPSSPPFYPRDPSTVEIHVDESMPDPSQHLPKRAPTSMQYRRTEESGDEGRGSPPSLPPDTCSLVGPLAEQTALSLSAASESRRVSGRSDIRNEDFSPILLERRQASNGKTIYGPAELSPDELRKRLEKLRLNQKFLAGDADEEGADGQSENPVDSGNPETTKDYEQLGGFINFRRGGRSEDGSFRNHGLSSALNDTYELHPEESLQASTPKQFPTVRVDRWEADDQTPSHSPDLPPVPHPSPEKRPEKRSEKLLIPPQGSIGSPLKLFQPYDTFTNQTLLRRLSQFQEGPNDLSFSIAQEDPYDNQWQAEGTSGLRLPSGSPNRFGAGELDGYEFNDEFSQMSYDASGMDGDKENRGPDGDSMQPSLPPIFELSQTSSLSDAEDLVVRRRRQKPIASHFPRHPRRDTRASFPPYIGTLSTPRRRDTVASEIKRPRTSPSKDPTPKRRRTLHKSDVSYGADGLARGVDSVQLSHLQMQSAIGRHWQDARSSGQHEMAEAEAAPAPQELRPRTPHQASDPRFNGTPPAALPMGATLETDRKPSIRTEDFINEANKIMAMIRSKAGLPSGLASLEESDAEYGQPSPDLESSFQESTQEPFSRPPSREGRPPLSRMPTKQEDPALVERLKQYEEASDMGEIIASSMRSAALPKQAIPDAKEHELESRSAWGSNGSRTSLSGTDFVSDPPNIRISRNPGWEERQFANGQSDGVPSQSSTGPSTQSTGMSVPTDSSRGSSRGSEARKTIAPESVLHLIPDRVGNMVLDRQRNLWVKRKPTAASAKRRESFPHSEVSEDDPFADIPDLSVDMTMEMQNLMLGPSKKELTPQDDPPRPQSPVSPSRPSTAASMRKMAPNAAAEPTCQPNPSQEASVMSMHVGEQPVEHEISINDGRGKEPRRLTISFSSPIASVIQDVADIGSMISEDARIPDQAAEDSAGDSFRRGRRIISVRATSRRRSSESRSQSRGPPRHLSVRGQSLMARPVSRIDERDEESNPAQAQSQEGVSGMELSVLGDYGVVGPEPDAGQQAGLSVLLATPARSRDCPVAGVDGAPIMSQYVGTFSLSPLSEFTVHRAEETLPLEASYVVGDHHLVTGDRSKRVMSMSMRDLVEKLAEVEPFEPYWEDMQELDLRGKGLGALHALDEFCGQLVSLDVSKNNIGNLSGIPSSVRHLRATDNQLSSLTAWSHLMNLQYVDVSNNGLTSLAAFKSLVHLRSLRADNNQITSLDGIKYHRGLQTLRVRGNLIEDINFDGATMDQLAELDLKNNRIKCIANLGQLSSLNSLNLESNHLSTFSLETNPLPSLKYLHLDDNRLTSLDIKLLPHLRLLHADRNALVRIQGFSRARRIDSLSLREQHGPEPLDLPHLLARAYEVRKLYLSGNLLSRFEPPLDLLNLQLLELANCGLTGLPEDVGLAMPNLRVLNLNMNALSDLRGLRAVQRLKRVFVAGNRIADGAALVDVFAGLHALREVDCRDNPVTLGFYAPALQQRRPVVVAAGKGDDGGAGDGELGGEFVLPAQDAERDARYCQRLDMATRMRRRVWETLVRSRCARVTKLDGLDLGADAKPKGADGDVVWRALAEKGLVLRRDGKKVDVKKAEKERDKTTCADADRSARWPAEDSFA